jgi:hypothetical protein
MQTRHRGTEESGAVSFFFNFFQQSVYCLSSPQFKTHPFTYVYRHTTTMGTQAAKARHRYQATYKDDVLRQKCGRFATGIVCAR